MNIQTHPTRIRPAVAGNIRPVDVEIAYLRQSGFSPSRAIIERAVKIKELVDHSKFKDAAEMARDVEKLQAFHYEQLGLSHSPIHDGPKVATRLTREWADSLLHAPLDSRRFVA